MRSYVVMERGPSHEKGAETLFVKDAFSVWAWIFPLIWLLWYRLWFPLVMFLLASALLVLFEQAAPPPLSVTIASLLVGAFVALEGPMWRVAKLRAKGYVEAGSVQAANLEEAEIRWFHRRPAPLAKPAMSTAATGTFGRPQVFHADASDMFFGHTDATER